MQGAVVTARGVLLAARRAAAAVQLPHLQAPNFIWLQPGGSGATDTVAQPQAMPTAAHADAGASERHWVEDNAAAAVAAVTLVAGAAALAALAVARLVAGRKKHPGGWRASGGAGLERGCWL